MWFLKKKKNEFLTLVEELRCDHKLKSFGFLARSQPQKNLNLNTEKYANSLFVGSMGSGKSVAVTTSVFAEMLSSPNDLVFTIDAVKGATDFCFLQKYNRFISLVNDESLIEPFFDLIFKEFSQRIFFLRSAQSPNLDHYNNKNVKKISKINIVMECCDYIMEVIMNQKKQTAKQLQILLKKGHDYGINFVFITTRVNNMNFPRNILDNISNIVAFKMNNIADANYINLPKAFDISVNDRGQAVMKNHRVQFMYLKDTIKEQYVEDDISQNGNPFPLLLTLNQAELTEIKRNQKHILNQTKSEITECVDEEDIDFWNWVNSKT